MGKIMRHGIPYGGSSSKSSSFAYDNSNTTLTATNLQAAIDELSAMISAISTTEYCTVTYVIDTGIEYIEDVKVGTSCLDPVSFTPELSGYVFVGWKKDTVASGGIITNRVAINTEPITLYAVFGKDITLSYDGNGSTSGSTAAQTGKTYYNNGNITYPTFTLAANGFTKTNYNFNGWDLGAAGTEIEITQDTTAKAQWVGTPYTWVNNSVGSGATLSITLSYPVNTTSAYSDGKVLNTFKLQPTRNDSTKEVEIRFTTNAVSTKGCKYMTIVFDSFWSDRFEDGADWLDVRNQSGTVLATYKQQYTSGQSVKVDVSTASSVYLYGRLGGWGYDPIGYCNIRSISFSN